MSKTRAATKPIPPVNSADGVLPKVFPALFGAFLGVAFLKFPNPPIMAKYVETPTNGFEWVLGAWPVWIAYWLLGGLALVGVIGGISRPGAPKWLLAMPLVWLGWQVVAATQTTSGELTAATMKHFVACSACFYLGAFCCGRNPSSAWFFALPTLALAMVIAAGFDQHFGGLEGTRQYFRLYAYDDWQANRPEQLADYWKRISSNRIFSTLFYPNALAGVLLLALPMAVVTILKEFVRLTFAARIFLAGLVGVGGLACLFWSGSKGGWLLMLALGALALVYSPMAKKIRVVVIAAVLLAGLAGFAMKYAGYFERKATSVSARFDYWQAALHTVGKHPVFGSGPGTFAIAYQTVKRPESEMARLTHNDYLQQASDSGLLGAMAYMVFIVGVLFQARPGFHGNLEPLRFAVWLGVAGWALQGLMEFPLYVPALSWFAFAMMGWLLSASPKPFDKPKMPV